MGLVHRMAHSWSISVLDDLVVGLVSSSCSQEGRNSNKNLKENVVCMVTIYIAMGNVDYM